MRFHSKFCKDYKFSFQSALLLVFWYDFRPGVSNRNRTDDNASEVYAASALPFSFIFIRMVTLRLWLCRASPRHHFADRSEFESGII